MEIIQHHDEENRAERVDDRAEKVDERAERVNDRAAREQRNLHIFLKSSNSHIMLWQKEIILVL